MFSFLIFLLLLPILIIVVPISQITHNKIKYKEVKVNWQSASKITMISPHSCDNQDNKITFQWKGDLYEGTNCRFFIDEQSGPSAQEQDFRVYKNRKLVLSRNYTRFFKFLDCGNKLCIFATAPVGDSIFDYISWGREPRKGTLTVILWPDKKTLSFPNPCRNQNQAVSAFDIKQESTKKFLATISCSTYSITENPFYYKGEIELY